MGYSKPYAKPCKFCKTVQVVWDEKLEGPNKFKEVQTNQPHTRERCDAAKGGGQQGIPPKYTPKQQEEFMESYGYPKQEQQTSDFQLAQLITKVDNLAIGIAKIMSILQNQAENNPTQRDNMKLRQQVTELEEVIKKRGLVTPASELAQSEKETQPDYDQHVRDMVEKGKQAEEDEELDLT